MRIELDPPTRAGPVVIGMPFDEAEEVLGALPSFQSWGNSAVPTRGFACFDSGLAISAFPSRDGLVEAVEAYPSDDPHRDVVEFRGINVFATPADEVIRLLTARTRTIVEDGGLRLTAPDLLLAFWRPVLPEDDEDEDGRYFKSALVARPGYYDGPS